MSYENKGSVVATVTVSVEPDRRGNFVCSGAADEVEINAALAYANTLGGGKVVLLEGTYTIADPISFPGNELWLAGMGRATFIDGDGLATTEHAIVIDGRTDCMVSDLSVQTADGGGNDSCPLMVRNGAHRFRIERVFIVDSDEDGIRIEGTNITEGWILDCVIIGADDFGIEVLMTSANYMKGLTISGNKITTVGDDGMMTTRMDDSFVINNRIYNVTSYGIYLFASNTNIVSGNKIDTITGGGAEGIVLSSCVECAVVGNVIDAQNDGIAITQSSNYCTVVGNTVDSNNSAIEVKYSDHVTVSGNTLQDAGAEGIEIEDAEYVVISGNAVMSAAGNGIQVLDCALHPKIVGNTLRDSTGFGISLEGDTNFASVQCNTTEGNGGSVNVAAGCDNTRISDNNLDEGAITDAPGTNTRAWLNYDPSANAFIATINAPAVVGGGGGALP